MINETIAFDKWGYLVGISMLFILWGLAYFARRDLRSRILFMSIILLPLAPIGQYYFLRDYWHPPLILPIQIGGYLFGGLADLLFAFVMGGIATAAFPILFRQNVLAERVRPRHWVGLAFLIIEGTCVVVLTEFLHINSIFSSSIGFIITALLMVIIRHDLSKCIVISGLISGLALACAEGILSFIVPLYLSRYWYLYHTGIGILIVNRIPITELMWGITFGMVIGPIIDFYKGQMFIADIDPEIAASKKTTKEAEYA